MPVNCGWTLPGTTPQTPGISSVFRLDGDDAGRGADDVDDVALAAARAQRIPVRVEGADGDGDAGAEGPTLRPTSARGDRRGGRR